MLYEVKPRPALEIRRTGVSRCTVNGPGQTMLDKGGLLVVGINDGRIYVDQAGRSRSGATR